MTCGKIMRPAKLFLRPVPRCICSPSLSSIPAPAAWSHAPQGPGCSGIVARQHMLADLVSTGQSREREQHGFQQKPVQGPGERAAFVRLG